MKKTYKKPEAKKIIFQYEKVVALSGCSPCDNYLTMAEEPGSTSGSCGGGQGGGHQWHGSHNS